MTAPDRNPCVIVGCRRTAPRSKFPDCEIVCGKHWRLGDRRWRQLHSKITRKVNRSGFTPALVALEHRVWERLKAQITERAMGIG